MKSPFFFWFMFLGLCWFTACGGSATDEGENYGDLLSTNQGLTLTKENHLGWERSDCNMCHNLNNIHLVNRTEVNIDIKQVHDQAIQNGNSGCVACHGTNGL